MTETKSFNILYLSLEFSRWQQARSWSYLANFGFEEGFAANGITFLTVPALMEFAPDDSASWLSHIKTICDGKQFEQVWIEIVHINLDDTILSYLATLAPVRLAIIGESLIYTDEVYNHAPHLKNRQAEVVHRLKYMTHALVADEKDEEWLNSCGIIKALWWVQAVPERAISTSVLPVTYKGALFSGALYGDREQWLLHPLLHGLLEQQQPLEEDAQLPALFDQINTHIIHTLRTGDPFYKDLLYQHVNLLREIRRQSFALWLKGLICGSAVVNLPSFYQGYAGRVYEGMAAGRPVISWEIPDHPRTNALFENGKDILLFPKDNPTLLSEQIRRVVTDHVFAEHLVTNASSKLKRFHTIEIRTRQIMKWIESGKEPVYHDEEVVKGENEVVNSYYVDLWNDPAWSSPHPNTDEEARWTKISELLNSYCSGHTNKHIEPLRILDVGCGRGWLSSYLEKYGEYVGIEPVPGAVEIANNLFPGRTFLAGYTGDLLMGSAAKFDIIVSTEVIEHVPYNKQKDFVSDLYALLNNDGLLILTTPRGEVYDYMLARGLHTQPVDDWLTEEQLETLFEANGFIKFGMERIFYDAPGGRFYLNPTDHEINLYGLIALYQVWAFIKTTLADKQILANNNLKRLSNLPLPMISVIIPCYNQASFLLEAVESIISQTCPNWECIIVNDGSPDNTSSIVRYLINRYPQQKIQLVEKSNGGLADARNAGVRVSSGEFILFLDADDKIHPYFLEEAAQVLMVDARIGFVYTNVQHFGARTDLWSGGPFDPQRFLRENQLTCSALFRRRMYDEVGGLKLEMKGGFEDWEFWISGHEMGWLGFLINKPYFFYRKHQICSMLENIYGDETKINYLKAKIISLHKSLYAPEEIAWANSIISVDSPFKD